MKRILMATLLTTTGTVFMASAGMAAPAADHNPAMPAVATSDTTENVAPAAGRNSFTLKQATARLNEQGYSKVSNMKKDSDGIWRGNAMMNGGKHSVALDYQGNVTAE